MLVSHSFLQRTVKAIQRFDPGGSPYVGIQWGAETPLFHRSSDSGIIESLGYDRTKPALVVSLPHLASTLTHTTSEQLEMSVDRGGILALVGDHEIVGSSDSEKDDLRVYTIRQNVTWARAHDIGEEATEIPRDGFKGINTSLFELDGPPVLRRNNLMLPTKHGIIMHTAVPVEAYPYPRDVFMRSVAALPVERIYTTRGGYWGAVAGELRFFVAGHRSGDSVFDRYSIGATRIAEFAADRLLWACKSASDLAADGTLVTLDPAHGMQVRDTYGHSARYTFRSDGEWAAFNIRPRTARVLHDALTQTKEEAIELQQMDATTLRMKRGPWQVSFRYYGVESPKPK